MCVSAVRPATTAAMEAAAPPAADAAPADAQAQGWTARMVRGDRTALAEVFHARCVLVERFAERTLGHRADLVPDAAQEAWLRVARRPVECASAGALDAWLRCVTAAAALDLLRADLARRARERRAALARPEATDHARAFVQDAALLETVRHAVERLAAEDRAVLELRARTTGTLRQLGAALGLGPAAVDSRLRRAAERARAALDAARQSQE